MQDFDFTVETNFMGIKLRFALLNKIMKDTVELR